MKNLKKIIIDVIMLICPILLYVFMSQSYVVGNVSILGQSTQGSLASGFDLINFEGNDAATFNAVCLLLTCIFAGILMLSALVSLLADFKIIKNNMVVKAVSILKFISIVVIFITTIASLIYVASEYSKQVGVEGANISAGADWAVIVNMILGFVLVIAWVFTFVEYFKRRK